jgi:uncharacterized membrane protein
MDSPSRILGERFARGEISADEYRDRSRSLSNQEMDLDRGV